MISVNQMVLIMVAQGFIILLAVLTGGLLVFRTKREAYDPLFQFKEKQGSSFNMSDDEGRILEPEKEPELPPIVKEFNEKFKQQVGG